MEEARYNMYTKTKARPRLRNFPPNIAPTCFFVCNVLVIVMERHLILTLTSDHINNVPEVRFVQNSHEAIYWGGHVGF